MTVEPSSSRRLTERLTFACITAAHIASRRGKGPQDVPYISHLSGVRFFSS